MSKKKPTNPDLVLNEVTEEIEQPEPLEAEVLDLFQKKEDGSDAEAPSFHPILHVWQQVLQPAEEQSRAPITPDWAQRICSTYLELTFKDMPVFQSLYFQRMQELNQILLDEIDIDEECLTYATAEEDKEFNSGHYRYLLQEWQVQFLKWQMAWDCEQDDAAADLASLGEIHKFFFSDKGITPFLDNIKFDYTEEDQANLVAALDEVTGGTSE
jgi:hypothetical protein